MDVLNSFSIRMGKVITILGLFSIFLILSCTPKSSIHMEKNKLPDIPTEDKKVIITAPLVLKNFVKKNAEVTDIKEWYIQRSVQDYFIKFCESEVSRKELEKYLTKQNNPLNTCLLYTSDAADD